MEEYKRFEPHVFYLSVWNDDINNVFNVFNIVSYSYKYSNYHSLLFMAVSQQ